MVEHVHLLYFSPTGNSRTTANAIAFGLEANVDLNQDLTHKAERDRILAEGLEFDQEDVVVICFPVYAGRLPRFIAELFSNIHAKGSKAILAVTYGNRAYEDSLLELKDLATGAGFVPICAGAFVGVHSYDARFGEGRPDAKDLDRMHALGRRALEKLSQGEVLMQSIPGNSPYRAYVTEQDPAYGTSVNGHCCECGACVSVCPVEAIDPGSPFKTDFDRCIRCSACIKACPLGVRKIVDPRHDAIMAHIEPICLEKRREAELFY